jgi:hypothetical protein
MRQRVFAWGGSGFVIGVIVASPLAFAVQLSKTIFETINAPALLLAHCWTYNFGLPPQGEVAWLVVPIAAVIVQWTLRGLLLGSCLSLRLWRTPSAPTADGTRTCSGGSGTK